MADPGPDWVCCQLGAREHYAIARALRGHGHLARLVTDAWMPPGSPWRALPGSRARRLEERYHGELAAVPVTDFTASLIAHEVGWRVAGRQGWDLFIARNLWFQRRAAEVIARQHGARGAVVFAHSYAALEVFRAARHKGWRCVLGQIDPGERHFAIVREAAAAAPEFGPAPPSPPPRYFDMWREECRLAAHVVVNSEWSRQCLIEAGIAAKKLTVIPLAYESGSDDATSRRYPERFSNERPLRALFVGHATIAKGIKPLLESLALVADLPIVLTIVGALPSDVPDRFTADARIRWAGPVSRSAVMEHYRAADVLVFPSLSDGFGMAQIEARGWRVPVIASRSCGRVVDDDRDGILLPTVTSGAIAAALRRVVDDPPLLARYSQAAAQRSGGLASLGQALLALGDA